MVYFIFYILFAIHFPFLHLDVIGGQEEKQEVQICLCSRESQHLLIHPDVIFYQRELVARYRFPSISVIGEGVLNGVCHSALLDDGQEESPVLSLAQVGHKELLSQFLDIVHRRRTSDLIVALQHPERYSWRCQIDTRLLIVVVADDVRRTYQCAVSGQHQSQLLLQFVGKPSVIAVAEGYIPALSTLNGFITGITGSMVLFQELHFYAFVLGGIVL